MNTLAASAAALEPGLLKLLDEWRAAKRLAPEYSEQVASARARRQSLPAEIVAAAANPSRLAELRLERAAAEQLVADAPLVLQGLEEAARDAGLAWSSAWTEWKNRLEAEMIPDFSARRQRVDDDEARAWAAFDAKLAAMPAE